MSANAAQVALLALRLRLWPRQIRVILASVTAVRSMHELANDDEKMRACDIVLETELVESNCTIYANGNNHESLRLYHEAVGWDHGSVGPLQQQVGGAVNSTANWGTTAECMDPAFSSKHFVRVLVTKTWNGVGWQHLSNGVAAQMVQGSAFPDRYAQRDGQAISIRKAVWNYCAPGSAVKPSPPKAHPSPKPVPVKKPVSGKVVTIKRNQGLSDVAKANHVSLQALEHANPRAGHPAGNFNVVWPGDKVRIP